MEEQATTTTHHYTNMHTMPTPPMLTSTTLTALTPRTRAPTKAGLDTAGRRWRNPQAMPKNRTIQHPRTKSSFYLPTTAALHFVVPARFGGRALTKLDHPTRHGQIGDNQYPTSTTVWGGKHFQGKWAGGGLDPSSVHPPTRGRREPGGPGREGQGPCSP
jgi:hypothetical protein